MATKIVSPLAGWLGGKMRLAKRIVPLIPPHHTYIEPFAGGAWIFFRKDPAPVEVLNDLNADVVTLYRVVKNHHEEFLRQMNWTLLALLEFERLWRMPVECLTDIQRAARYFQIIRMSFSGRMAGKPSFSRKCSKPANFNPLRVNEIICGAYERLAQACIECLPYQEILMRYDSENSFFYIDPPYFGREQYYGKDMFHREDFARLPGLLKNLRGKFLLSLNDVPRVRKLFANFSISSLSTCYTCAPGRNSHPSELLIANF